MAFWCYSRWKGIGEASLKLLVRIQLAPVGVNNNKVKGEKMAEVKEVTPKQLAQIKDYIESIKYGSVNIVIQDGKIIQIDKSEKIRL